jgi:hypothetical protein
MNRLALALTAMLLVAPPAMAQRLVIRTAGPEGPPAELVRALEGSYRVIMAPGQVVTVARTQREQSTLIIIADRARVSGSVEGDVILIGSQLFVAPGATITGRAVAIGGGSYQTVLGRVDGGYVSIRDFTYDATMDGGTIHLDYRALRVPGAGRRQLTSVFRVPTYDRANGLSIPAQLSAGAGGGEATVRATYRSQLGIVDPTGSLRTAPVRGWHAEATGGRLTYSNEQWIHSDMVNTLFGLATGRDSRNWYRGDRLDLRLRREPGTGTVSMAPWVGARVERSWSARPDSTPGGGPWSLLGGSSATGMRRPNPPADAGRIHSVMAGGRAQLAWEDLRGSAELSVESSARAPGARQFTQLVADAQLAFPTFGTQRFTLEAHTRLTAGDVAPSQRWGYVGGAGTLSTLELLELGGDQVFFTDARYEIPIERVQLPVVGAPTLTLRHLLAGAAVGEAPELIQGVGVRLGVRLIRLEVLADSRDRSPKLSLAVSLDR